MFTFDTQSDAITGQFPLEQIFPNTTNIRILFINSEQEEDDSDMDPEMREFYSAAMRGATSERFLPENHYNNRDQKHKNKQKRPSRSPSPATQRGQELIFSTYPP